MSFKSFLGKKIAERKELKQIYKTTLHEEKKKYAGEKAKIKVAAIKKKAKERARTPFITRTAKGLSKMGEGLSKLPLPRLRDDFDTGFGPPKKKSKKRGRGGFGDFDLGF